MYNLIKIFLQLLHIVFFKTFFFLKMICYKLSPARGAVNPPKIAPRPRRHQNITYFSSFKVLFSASVPGFKEIAPVNYFRSKGRFILFISL